MKINLMYRHVVIKTEVEADGVDTYCEVTKEQYKRIEESFKTGKYEYMSDDPELADITDPIVKEGDEDARNQYGELAKELKTVVEYPSEISGVVKDCGGIQIIKFPMPQVTDDEGGKE